jgi:putative tricarboxylic transport membrane protein
VSIVYCIVGSVLIGAVLTLGTGIILSRPLAALTRIPIPILVPVVSIISVVGVYASSFTYAHIFVAMGAGVLGYAFVRLEYPIVAFLLGFIVGPLAEENFMRSYQITGGHLELIFLRPICAVLLVLSLLVIARPLWRNLLVHRRSRSRPRPGG